MLGSLLRSVWTRPKRADMAPAAGTHSAFVRELATLIAARIGAQEEGNFDNDRWPEAWRGLAAASEKALAAAALEDLALRAASLASVCELFADATSRDWFRQLLAYRILGHARMRLPSNCAAYWEARECAKRLAGGASPFRGLFGPLSRYAVEFDGEPIEVDCWRGNIAATFYLRQYYLARDSVRVGPMPGDYVVDAGACYGDTALAFAASVGSRGQVHSFEVDPANTAIARHNFAANPALAQRIRLHEIALGQREGVLFRHGSGPGARVTEEPSKHEVRVTSIDLLVEAGAVERVDFIKMDVEGAELDALAGARETLLRFRPRLAISVYHRPQDLWRIPAWLEALGAGYRFYLDHYTIHHEESVLYAQAST